VIALIGLFALDSALGLFAGRGLRAAVQRRTPL
jgi:hypothetical protein